MKVINRIFRFKNNIAFDHRILFPVLILSIIGLIALKSTSIDALGEHSVFYKQLIWILIGGLIFILIQFMRNQIIYEFSYIFYLILLLLLVLTLFMPKVNGSSRWIFLGAFQLQPSEFGKIILIVALSRFISDYKDNISNHHLIISCGFISLIPLFLICLQPDFGTAIMYVFPIIPMLYWSDIDMKILILYIFPFISILAAFDLIYFYLWMLILTIILILTQRKTSSIIINFIINSSFGLSAPFVWFDVLEKYHRKRILSMLDPSSEPLGAGYQILQSKVAIGSGGLWGKGLGEGTQSYLRFLPIKDSDFILSVISEEMGLIAIVFILFMVLLFIYINIDFSQRLFNKFQSLNIIGFSSLFFFHVLINMSMVVGIFPVIGLPFPLISYGGSFMLSNFIMIGIINNVVSNEL